MTCKFCNIAKHVTPEHIIYEDKLIMAFMSIEQLTKCHVLVIPKKHYKDIFELDEKVAERIFRITTRISKTVKKVVKPDGIDIYQCNGKYAGQVIFHFHMHIFPRFKGDGLFNVYNNKKPLYRNDNYLEKVAKEIRDNI
jgi:histidine triad (HIT) family protein